jgi:hypothetical protein
MLVYKDILSGDAVLSDSYEIGKWYEGTVFKVKSKQIKVCNNDFDIEDDKGDSDDKNQGENCEMIIDVVHSFSLQETSFDKKSYMSYIKSYMKKINGELEKSNSSRIDVWKKNMQDFVKYILGNFEDFQFFTGEKMDVEAMIILAKYEKDDDTAPTFYYIADGLKAEKV